MVLLRGMGECPLTPLCKDDMTFTQRWEVWFLNLTIHFTINALFIPRYPRNFIFIHAISPKKFPPYFLQVFNDM
ncbi:hypothetical protein HanRHA438_Chr17g0818371 [Helianthus annuus]|nr:hypothetical protein HanRHA438_Chr17g0818371 [Helianthus annuus]